MHTLDPSSQPVFKPESDNPLIKGDWRGVWHTGYAPQLTREQLEAWAVAIRAGHLLQWWPEHAKAADKACGMNTAMWVLNAFAASEPREKMLALFAVEVEKAIKAREVTSGNASQEIDQGPES